LNKDIFIVTLSQTLTFVFDLFVKASQLCEGRRCWQLWAFYFVYCTWASLSLSPMIRSVARFLCDSLSVFPVGSIGNHSLFIAMLVTRSRSRALNVMCFIE